MKVFCNRCGFSAELKSSFVTGEGALCPRCQSPIPMADEGEAPAPGAGLPWEHRSAFLDLGAMAATVKGALIRPKRAFSHLKPGTGYGSAILFFILTVLVGGLGSQFSEQVAAAVSGGELASPGELVVKVALLLIGLPLAAPVAALFISGLVHTGLRLVRAAGGGFSSTFRVVAYVGGSTSLFNVVPVVGPVVGFIWSVISEIRGLSAAHATTWGRALLGLWLGFTMFILIVIGIATIVGLGAVGLIEIIRAL